MRHSVLYSSFFSLAMMIAAAATGASNTFQLKVDLKVEELSMNEARIILMQENKPAKLVEGLGKLVVLNLEMGSSYLIEFQRHGCITRQLMVDTRVPMDRLSTVSRTYATRMKLQMPDKGQNVTFLGPVGYIHYDATTNSFRYDRDYAMLGELAMIEDMRAERERFALPEKELVIPKRGYVTYPGYEYGTRVRTGTDIAPLVHLTGTSSTTADRIAPAERENVLPVQVEVPEFIAFVASVSVPAIEPDLSITEELHVSTARIIKDVHVFREGVQTDYRKVTERYGDVYYFKNGNSCSELTYLQGTTPQNNGAIAKGGCTGPSCQR